MKRIRTGVARVGPASRAGQCVSRNWPLGLAAPTYFAVSVNRLSRIIVTLISPGYVSCCFERLGDVAADFGGRFVGRHLGAGDDADLAAGLDRERLLDALEAGGDRFQFLHPLDVAVERFAAGAGPRGAAGVGRGDEHRVRHVGADVVVMAERGVDHFGAFAVALEEVGADLAGGRLPCRGRPPCRCRAAGRPGGPGRRPSPFPRPSCWRRTPLRSNAAARSGCSWCGSAAGPSRLTTRSLRPRTWASCTASSP